MVRWTACTVSTMATAGNVENIVKELMKPVIEQIEGIVSQLREREVRDAVNTALPTTPNMEDSDGNKKAMFSLRDFDVPQLTGEEKHRETAYRNWSTKIAGWVEDLDPEAAMALQRAELAKTPIRDAQTVNLSDEKWKVWKARLYTTVKMKTCDGAQRIVLNVPDKNGFEAWRSLKSRIFPITSGSGMNDYSELLTIPEDTLNDLYARIDNMDEICQRHFRERGKMFDLDLMKSKLISLVTAEVRNKLIINGAEKESTTYE